MKPASSGYKKALYCFGLVLVVALCTWLFLAYKPPASWSEQEKTLIASLWLGNLPPLPHDLSNAVDFEPQAARLGHALFFDTRLSGNNEFSCATCHQPERRFTDGLDKARAIGQSQRNTPSIVGLAYSPWLYWDGRRDSLWAQALSPLEDPEELGGNRMRIARRVIDDPQYSVLYENLFGELPNFTDRSRFPQNAGPDLKPAWNAAWRSMALEDRELVNQTFANIGKVIAAYERLLVPAPSRFDDYADALLNDSDTDPDEVFSNEEIKGLRLFIGDARCMECHNGPLFTNNEFHNTGIISYPGDLPDRGRIDGVREVRKNEFNCLGAYSDAGRDQCPELTFARDGAELIGALKTPSLRNIAGTAPYMHKGQIATIADVLDHYNEAPFAMIGHNEAETPLRLLPFELRQLEAFLNTLDAPIDVPERWLHPPQ